MAGSTIRKPAGRVRGCGRPTPPERLFTSKAAKGRRARSCTSSFALTRSPGELENEEPDEKYCKAFNDGGCGLLRQLFESSNVGTVEYCSSGASHEIIPLA